LDHIELYFILDPKDPFADILTAQLAEVGFDTFTETDDGLKAYIGEELFSKELLARVDILSAPGLRYTMQQTLIPRVNWNEEWEKNFHPVEVGTALLIRAPFHPVSNKHALEIVIEPKMSFGTGHHDTTWLMAQQLLGLDVKGCDVLDMGCGTGILAILASRRGAKRVLAIDIEDWACENTRENAGRNGIFNITVEKGEVNLLAGKAFQLILANINKNVLLRHLPLYASALSGSGMLLLSGFFESDTAELEAAARAQGLLLKDQKERNGWALLHFAKGTL
jgi:ribosomal protein L11 methyltransferase